MINELLQSLFSHKTRTVIAVLTVAWGVFMLIVLLGTGNGLQNGVELQFSDEATNSIRIYGGATSIPSNGVPSKTPVFLNNMDREYINQMLSIEDKSSASYEPEGRRLTTYGEMFGVFTLLGIYPDQFFIEKSVLTSGRFINSLDIDRKRKVAVLGAFVKKALFGEKDPIGQRILIDGFSYLVVGTFSDTGDRDQEALIYLPITTVQSVFTDTSRVDSIAFTLTGSSRSQSVQAEEQIKRLIADRHHYDRSDNKAIHIVNNLEEYSKFIDIFKWVGIFVALVGVGTILTGIVAVSNIMVVSVAERTKEIGIRKAIGATPRDITMLVVLESIVITVGAALIGLALGLGLLKILQITIEENEYMYSPEIDAWIGIAILLIVLLAGVLSGYFPAAKAARVNPIEALKK